MITYKYKLYRTDKTKHLDKMLAEACFVWNHALALQKRYYRMYGKYISIGEMQRHQAKRIRRCLLMAQTVQEIIERLDKSYIRFFEHKATRPPKFKKIRNFSSFVFKQGGYSIDENRFKINKIGKIFKISKSREYEGRIKQIKVKRNKLCEYFIYVVTDAKPKSYGKSRKGASVGIDFGLKTYLTLSDDTKVENPQFMKESLNELRRKQRNLDKCKKDSNNRERKRRELAKLWDDINNKRNDFQWKLAHFLCRKYDTICIEDLNLLEMRNDLHKRTRRKLNDLSHSMFVQKLEYVSAKYGVVVHKIGRYYPSSKSCTCGYVNRELKLTDRKWICPHCGAEHDRDLLAAQNILRRGIAELESGCKTSKHFAERQPRLYPAITLS